MSWDEWRIWVIGEGAFFRPIYRLPNERDNPPQTRPGLLNVGAPPTCGRDHIHQFRCFEFPDPANLPWVAVDVSAAFAFADALHIAHKGELAALLKPYQTPLLKFSRRNIFYRKHDVLRMAEVQAIDSYQLKEAQDAAYWLAVVETPLEAPVGEVYSGILRRARRNLVDDFFGPRGTGFYTAVEVESLDAKLQSAEELGAHLWWLADPRTLEDDVLDRLELDSLPLPDTLTSSERAAIFHTYWAKELGYSLKEYCSIRGLTYGSEKQNLSRARKRLRDFRQ